MNLRVPQNAWNFLIAEELSASQEELCYIELENGGSWFLDDLAAYLPNYTVSHPRSS
jgi:hypothetical protein